MLIENVKRFVAWRFLCERRQWSKYECVQIHISIYLVGSCLGQRDSMSLVQRLPLHFYQIYGNGKNSEFIIFRSKHFADQFQWSDSPGKNCKEKSKSLSWADTTNLSFILRHTLIPIREEQEVQRSIDENFYYMFY